MHALLVYPRFPVTYWGFQYSLGVIGKRASLPPLGLISVAALLPPTWQLRLIDLNLGELRDEQLEWADVVLTGGLLIQAGSMGEVIARAKRAGCVVAVGGAAPTASPELFPGADVVFQGEVEGRIDELLRALRGSRSVRTVIAAPSRFPDLSTVPVPRFDLLSLADYASMSVQYSRGCPYDCEFCDIIEIFGRKARVKSPSQVLAELDGLCRLGYRGTVFFVDDNFIGNRRAVKRLLPILRDWQDQRNRPFEFYTEASVDLAADEALLREMVQAGFSSVFVGVETPSVTAIAEAHKLQNLRVDLSEAIDRITGAGIEVMGGFIVGFDSDTPEIFELQRAFLARQAIPFAMVGILTALPGTRLWRRLQGEGRLRRLSSGDPFSRPNFVPTMNESELLRGYGELMSWLYSPREYYRRCEACLQRLARAPRTRATTPGELRNLLRAIWHVGLWSPRRRSFWRLLGKAVGGGRGKVRQAIVHAVQGEHLITYTRDHIGPLVERALAQLCAERGYADAEASSAQSESSRRGRREGRVAPSGPSASALPDLSGALS